jgi:predicted Rossmann-fold nucleotide-binding protein
MRECPLFFPQRTGTVRRTSDESRASHLSTVVYPQGMLPLCFHPFRNSLYSVDELFSGFVEKRAQSYTESVDFQIYLQYLAAGSYAPTDYSVATMEAVHDNAIRHATQSYLSSVSAKAAVAFMGGHDLPRNSQVYAKIAFLARDLARRKYLPISGGGPGAMEATHLGALHKNASRAALASSLRVLGRHPELPGDLQKIVGRNGKINRRLAGKAHAWLLPAYRIRRRMKHPGPSLAIPTWLYGHEPTTPFATKIAKYFQNSVREDRLMAIATHGVIYFEGRAGTLQEVFQDAAQNYYRVLGDFSPMIFFGTRQWSEVLPVVAVLKKLFTSKDFERHVCVTDEPAAVLEFLAQHGQTETPSHRLLRHRRAEGVA